MYYKPGVMIYFELLPVLYHLSNEEKGLLFQAIMQYGQNLQEDPLPDRLTVLWPLVKARIDCDSLRYDKVVIKKKYAAHVRWARRKGMEPLDFVAWQEKFGYKVTDEEPFWMDPQYLPSL